MKVRVLMLRQDDPAKCTAAKLVRLGLARQVKRIQGGSITLDPFAARYLTPPDRRLSGVVTAVDCSWNGAGDTFLSSRFAGIPRRLPPLLAGNPVNYAKQGKLTTVEAVSGALYVMGFRNESLDLLGRFGWGHTFYDLNQNLLEDYSRSGPGDDVEGIAAEYGLAP